MFFQKFTSHKVVHCTTFNQQTGGKSGAVASCSGRVDGGKDGAGYHGARWPSVNPERLRPPRRGQRGREIRGGGGGDDYEN